MRKIKRIISDENESYKYNQEEETDHINHAIVAKTHPPMYLMHKYWARKPHNVVSEYIKTYSKKGDIVLDPFSGSGVTAIEALKIGRKAIGVDLDPMAIFIAQCTAMPIDVNKYKATYELISQNIKSKIELLYQTKCEKCGGLCFITHCIWEEGVRKKKEKLLSVWYLCEKCSKKILHKNPDKYDLGLIEKVNKMNNAMWYPKNRFIWNSRINVSKDERVCDLFNKRALIALSMIYNEIDKVYTGKDIRKIMLFTFTSALAQASKLIPVVHGGEECKSWTLRGYWVPLKHFEINAWNCFSERYKKVVRGKEESNQKISTYYPAKKYEDLDKDANILFLNQSALDLSNIPTESVDYVFTDPPYGDSVPYLELDYMWSAWLKYEPVFEDEIIISDSPERKKNFDEYYKMLTKAFEEIFRVLKSNKWLTVTFHNTDIEIYNSIIRAAVYSGFVLDKILYQPPPRASAKSLLHPYGSAIGDYYIRFKRPITKRAQPSEKEIDELRFRRVVVETVKMIIAERGEPVTYNDILKGIYVELDKHGYLLASKPQKIEEIIKQNENIEFVFIKGKGWWFKKPDAYLLNNIPLKDRVEKTVIQVLKRKYKASYDDILQELFMTFKNALTPDPVTIIQILDEYAEKTKDKKWKLKPIFEVRESQHDKIIYYLCLLAKKAGYLFYSGHRDVQYDGNKIIDIKGYVEIDNLPNITLEQVRRLKEIDVLWIKNKKIEYSFEVENTTGFTEAIIRGSNIPYKADKYIVLPEERDHMLRNKLKEPVLEHLFSKGDWSVIFYGKIEEYIKVKRSQFNPNEFNKIAWLKGKEVDKTGQEALFN